MATTTTDRAAINRRNAQKSTGPRTPEGKSRSRFNALKHGMSAKTLVLPGEDANVLQLRIETWTADLQPRNEVEQFLVERSVQSSWQLERADRAEVALLSSRIRDLPAEEARRQQAEAATLGRQLLAHGEVTREASLQSQLLSAMAPGASLPLEVLDHPEIIVPRLESTAAGCQWMLDRWVELRAQLDQDRPWDSTEKVKAIRLLGKQPLDMDPLQWEDHLGMLNEVLDPDIDDQLEQRLDRQLDSRLPEHQPATVAQLRSVADRAMARLETIAAGHRECAEADAVQQSARLSFDPSNEGERLRRYQASCNRSLFRSLDILLKLRRSGLGASGGERTEEGSEEAPTAPVESESAAQDQNPPGPGDEPSLVVSHEIPFEWNGHPTKTARIEQGNGALDPVLGTVEIVENTTENEPTLASSDRRNSQDGLAAPPIDPEIPRNESPILGVAEVSRCRPSFLGALVSAMMLIVLFGASVRGDRDSQNEPTAAPACLSEVEVDLVSESPRSSLASSLAGRAPDSRQRLTSRDASTGLSLQSSH